MNCKWCKDTKKYYPLTGDPQECLECSTKENSSLLAGNTQAQAVADVAGFYGMRLLGVPVQINPYTPTITDTQWISPALGVAVSNIDKGNWGYMYVNTGGESIVRGFKARHHIFMGDIILSNDISDIGEFASAKCILNQ